LRLLGVQSAASRPHVGVAQAPLGELRLPVVRRISRGFLISKALEPVRDAQCAVTDGNGRALAVVRGAELLVVRLELFVLALNRALEIVGLERFEIAAWLDVRIRI